MSTIANHTPAQAQAAPSAKQSFLEPFEREHGTTMRVLRAYPADKAELRPHDRCRTARELAWQIVIEQDMAERALTVGLDFSAIRAMPPAPDTLDEIIATLAERHQRVVELVKGMNDEQLSEPTQFFVAPKTLGEVSRLQLLWLLLFDQIHHRGQFSIYLRMADGKVPSIYGPTGDEPWG